MKWRILKKPLQMSTAQEEAMLAELKAQVEKVRVACCLAAGAHPCFFFFMCGVCVDTDGVGKVCRRSTVTADGVGHPARERDQRGER